uniref:Uncharacterized protein n=1 Tax=viral metagenome TaxID=1070528 RepID=A0A6M3LBV4_9ZZZZ
MKEKEEIKEKYIIHGRRWFDKINGNTYHVISITTTSDSKKIYSSPNMEYGYGDHYRQTAYKELVRLGRVKKEDENNHDLNRERFIYFCSDVQRKKDL